jgi:hypothetical protein
METDYDKLWDAVVGESKCGNCRHLWCDREPSNIWCKLDHWYSGESDVTAKQNNCSDFDKRSELL